MIFLNVTELTLTHPNAVSSAPDSFPSVKGTMVVVMKGVLLLNIHITLLSLDYYIDKVSPMKNFSWVSK